MRHFLKGIIFFTFYIGFITSSFSQGLALGKWRDHLSYLRCVAVADAGDKVYACSPSGLFAYHKTENNLERLSKITGLSDIGFSTIGYDFPTNSLVIAYSNTNIDIIQNNKIINISDIKRKQILGKKSINSIFFQNNKAYLACGFGIVVIDLLKNEVKDTYIIGPNGDAIDVTSVTSDGVSLYATTEAGVYRAPILNSNLLNFNTWVKFETLPIGKFNNGVFYQNKILVNLSHSAQDSIYMFDGTDWSLFNAFVFTKNRKIGVSNNKLLITGNTGVEVFNSLFEHEHLIYEYFGISSSDPMQAVIDTLGNIWIADNGSGLVLNKDIWNYTNMYPNGPINNTVTNMTVQGDNLWVAAGGRNDAWSNIWSRDGMYSYTEDTWKSWNSGNMAGYDTIRDIVTIAVDPRNHNRVYAGTWGWGLIEMNNGVVENIYNNQNSSLQSLPVALGYYWVGVGGMAFDRNNNLWMSNSGAADQISVKKANGTWKSFNFGNTYSFGLTGNLMIDSYNQKWVVLPRGGGILVFSDNNTIDNTADDKVRKLGTSLGNGNLPSTDVYCFAEDLDGEVWIGTAKGIAVFYSPGSIFSNSNSDAQKILVEQDGFAQYLLESEVVTAIAIDGANRKWVGTQNAGVFMLSEDGTKQLLHFNTDNSPLLSNNIMSIAINHLTGEVFLGTLAGIVSYKGTATGGGVTFNNVYAFPNPVHENYEGLIAIRGLVQNADFKITDVSGALVYNARAEGGQAVWNGKNMRGEKAKTGVYLVFSTNSDGSESVVTKILFVN